MHPAKPTQEDSTIWLRLVRPSATRSPEKARVASEMYSLDWSLTERATFADEQVMTTIERIKAQAKQQKLNLQIKGRL